MKTTCLYGNRRAGPFLFLFFACLPLLASCQDDYAFGLGEARFKKTVAEGDVAAIMALSPAALERSGKAGPEAFYYLARWLEAKAPAAPKAPAAAAEAEEAQPQNGNGEAAPGEPGGAADLPPALADVGAFEESPTAGLEAAEPRERAMALYRLAMLRASGLAKTAGGEAFLVRRAARAAAEKTQASWEALLAATEEYERVLGPGWTASGRRLEALDALGRDAELLREIEGLRVSFPAEAEANADALLYFEGAASRRLGRRVWSPPLEALLLGRPTSEWTERALAFVQTLDPPPAEFPAATLAAARMRIEVRRRDYGAAYRAAARCLPLVVSPLASKQLLADAGKAFLYSGSSAEGLQRFAAAFDAGDPAAAPPQPELAWTADFYRARFLKALQRWDEAAAAFLRLAPRAPSPDEGDAARWYAAESRGKAAE
ncbi:MAG: hypothetical protein JNG85_04790, partial [Spirochaetaceae bacterium]|nr:hypothetical protein [Spirochaetaceae bacterium]